MRKQSLGFVLSMLAAAFLLGCNETVGTDSACCDTGNTGNPNYPPAFSLNTTTLFPIQNNNNRWWYSSNGHAFVIHVLDTITDNHTTYFKVSFAEAAKDTTINWIRRSSLGTEFSTSLSGNYNVLMPPTFDSKQGSFALSSTDDVNYTYLDSLLVNTKYRQQVMELTFPNRNIHGFDEIDLAVNVGVVRMIDNSGRFPLIYSLDSANINGVIYK